MAERFESAEITPDQQEQFIDIVMALRPRLDFAGCRMHREEEDYSGRGLRPPIVSTITTYESVLAAASVDLCVTIETELVTDAADREVASHAWIVETQDIIEPQPSAEAFGVSMISREHVVRRTDYDGRVGDSEADFEMRAYHRRPSGKWAEVKMPAFTRPRPDSRPEEDFTARMRRKTEETIARAQLLEDFREQTGLDDTMFTQDRLRQLHEHLRQLKLPKR